MLVQPSLPGLETEPALTHNLFFAALPDRAIAARIARLATHLRDAHGFHRKPLEADRLHVSLLGLGITRRLTPDLVALVSKAAATVRLTPCEVVFDRVVSFRGRPGSVPLVLLERDSVGAFTILRRALARAMAEIGFNPRARSDFTPHLTLLYGDRSIDSQVVEAIGWSIREFVLVDSLQGQHRHVPLGRWPLRG